jgi:hypothetical protein
VARFLSNLLLLSIPALAACLSKPGPPASTDAPSDVDARVDAPPIPDEAVFRRYAVTVADVDGDGYDDVIRWGNATEGASPRVWIWLGTDVPGLGAPHITLDPTFDTGKAWYEVLDVAVDDVVDASGGREVIILTAEDGMRPQGTTPQQRQVIATIFPSPIVGDNVPRVRTAPIDGDIGGLATAPEPQYIVGRTMDSGTDVELVFGGLYALWHVDALENTGSLGAPVPTDALISPGDDDLTAIQDMFAAPIFGVANVEQLVGIGAAFAWHDDGDAGAGPFTGPGQDLGDGGGGPRGASEYLADSGDWFAVASLGGSNIARVVTANDAAEPEVYRLNLITGDPTAIAMGDLNDNGLSDVVVLANSQLRVYRDLALNEAAATATPAMAIAGDSGLDGYDTLAVGRFDEADGDEIYVLGPTGTAARCYALSTPTALTPCQ